MMHLSSSRFFWLIVMLMSTTFCGESSSLDADIAIDDFVQTRTDALMQDKSGFWSNNPRRISVCFYQGAGWQTASSRDIQMIRDEVVSTYEKNSNVHFFNWGTCPDNYSPGIQIGMLDSATAPHTWGLGTHNLDQTPNMILNPTFNNWDPNCSAAVAGGAGRDFCFRAIANHEFGHALGAYHEQNRNDTPGTCKTWLSTLPGYDASQSAPANGTFAPTNGSWDIHSAMNYCNDSNYAVYTGDSTNSQKLAWNNGGNLSTGDIAGFQSMFGYSKNKLDVNTPFEPTNPNWHFIARNATGSGSRNTYDMIGLHWSAPTGSGKMEVHATSQASNYQTFTVHTASTVDAYANNPGSYVPDAFMGYCDGDAIADIIVVRDGGFMNDYLGTQCITGASNYQTIYFQSNSQLPNWSDYKFAIGDHDKDGLDDLYALRPNGSNNISLQILSGASKYRTVILDTVLAFDARAKDRCKWVVGDFNADGKPDLTCVLTAASSTDAVELHVFSGASNYSSRIVSVVTQLVGETYRNMDFSYMPTSSCNPIPNLGCGGAIVFYRRNGGQSTELHIMDGAMYM